MTRRENTEHLMKWFRDQAANTIPAAMAREVMYGDVQLRYTKLPSDPRFYDVDSRMRIKYDPATAKGAVNKMALMSPTNPFYIHDDELTKEARELYEGQPLYAWNTEELKHRLARAFAMANVYREMWDGDEVKIEGKTQAEWASLVKTEIARRADFEKKREIKRLQAQLEELKSREEKKADLIQKLHDLGVIVS